MGVCDRLVTADGAVQPPERRREAAARRGKRRETRRLENPRRPDVPGVREQKRRTRSVKVEEHPRFALLRHKALLCDGFTLGSEPIPGDAMSEIGIPSPELLSTEPER